MRPVNTGDNAGLAAQRRCRRDGTWQAEQWWVSTSGPQACAPQSCRWARAWRRSSGSVRWPCHPARSATARSSTPTPSPIAIKQLWAQAKLPHQAGRRRRRQPEGRRAPGRPALAAGRRAAQVAGLPGAGLHPDASGAGDPRLPPARGVHRRDGCAHAARAARRRGPRHGRQRDGGRVAKCRPAAGHGRPDQLCRAPLAGLRHRHRQPSRQRRWSTSAPTSPTSSSTRAAYRASCASCSWAAPTSPTPSPSAWASRMEQAEAVKQSNGLATSGGQRRQPPRGAGDRDQRHRLRRGGPRLAGLLPRPSPEPARIGRVVVSGGGSRLGGLLPRLSAATRLPVEMARPISGLTVGNTGLTDDQLAYVEPMVTVPVGLAMGLAS